MKKIFLILSMIVLGLSLSFVASARGPKPKLLLNVSYDPTREFYVEFNDAFQKYWEQKNSYDKNGHIKVWNRRNSSICKSKNN